MARIALVPGTACFLRRRRRRDGRRTIRRSACDDADHSSSAVRRQNFRVGPDRGIGTRTELFKLLEGLEKKPLPFSEHVYDRLRPLVGDLLFLGSDYESAFDRFELFYAIEFAHQSGRHWAPIGRFGWKGSRGEH